jgi:hypothetical protein
MSLPCRALRARHEVRNAECEAREKIFATNILRGAKCEGQGRGQGKFSARFEKAGSKNRRAGAGPVKYPSFWAHLLVFSMQASVQTTAARPDAGAAARKAKASSKLTLRPVR